MSLLGGNAIGRLAVAQEIEVGTTTVLAAAQGSFALTGEAATFRTQMVAAQGSLTLAGEAVAFQAKFPAAFGAFAETGLAVTFETFMASTQWMVPQGALGSSAIGAKTLGLPDENLGSFPLTFHCVLSGSAQSRDR